MGLDPHSQGERSKMRDEILSAGTLLASGGDDCKLKIWDTRDLKTPIATNSRFVESFHSNFGLRAHSAGVTVVTFDPYRLNSLLTGRCDGASLPTSSLSVTTDVCAFGMPGC